MRLSSFVLLGIVALAAAACTSIVIPTRLPAGPTTAPGGPTTAPGGPVAGNLCAAVTLQEVGQIAGGTATVADSTDADECTWTVTKSGSIIPGTINLRIDAAGSNDLGLIKSIWSEGADVAIADGGWWATGINGLWFYDGGNTYAVQLIFVSDDDAQNKSVAVQIGTLAAQRL